MTKLGLKNLQKIYNKREISKIPGFMYSEYVEDVVVLRELGVSYRMISEELNSRVKSRAITPQNLRRLHLKWIEIGFIDEAMMERLKSVIDKMKNNEFDDEKDVVDVVKEDDKEMNKSDSGYQWQGI